MNTYLPTITSTKHLEIQHENKNERPKNLLRESKRKNVKNPVEQFQLKLCNKLSARARRRHLATDSNLHGEAWGKH